MTTPTVPAEVKILAWFDTLGNWGRRGDDGELGARHFITDAKCRQVVSPPIPLNRWEFMFTVARCAGIMPPARR